VKNKNVITVALSMGTVISADLCTTCTSLQSGDQLCALSVWCQLWQQQQQQLEEGGEGGA
jgi:hypothetical protein